MNLLTPPSQAASRTALPPPARIVISLLEKIEGGAIRLVLPDKSTFLVGQGVERVTLQINNLAMFSACLAKGDIGFAESWLAHDWECEDLATLLTLLAKNRQPLARAVHGKWLPVLWYRLKHLMHNNTKKGSKRNILAHYDLGNAFYAQWLDPSMTYSAALLDPTTSTDIADDALENAQRKKYRRILESLAPKAGDKILEVGCGWGGFAEMATLEYGCIVHGITLSPSQLSWATERARKNGFSAQASFALTDYRDIRGQYDHIVSIEMFEAVGEKFWPAYFTRLKLALKPTGKIALQTITIDNARFDTYRRGTDFIQQYIFPGGMLPSPEAFERRVASADFFIHDAYAFGLGYAETLAHWRRRFLAAWPNIKTLGFDERFRRLWLFYLAYCEAGFRSQATDVYQYVLTHK